MTILPTLAQRLSRSFVNGVLLYGEFVCFLVVKKVRKDDRPWTFRFFYNDTSFLLKLFEGSPDIAALKEIFIDGEYAWDGIGEPMRIVDLGAHTGNTALYFHVLYPEATIYAVEASPTTFKKLLQNTEGIEHIIPIFGAISDTDGTHTFYDGASSLGSSLQRRGEDDCAVEVPCFTLETLFLKEGIMSPVDFMKIDIEGAEDRLFKEVSPAVFSRSYIVEVHDDLMRISRDTFIGAFNTFTIDFKAVSNPKRVLLRAHDCNTTVV